MDLIIWDGSRRAMLPCLASFDTTSHDNAARVRPIVPPQRTETKTPYQCYGTGLPHLAPSDEQKLSPSRLHSVT